jgi:hypothetical protein
MANIANPTDTDMSGTLITTEFGGPVVRPGNPQLYNLKPVYPGIYNPAFTPPPDQSEGGLALQEQEWVQEIEYLEAVDPDFLTGADIGTEVVFENPLDTLTENDSELPSDNTFTVVTADLETDIAETDFGDEVPESIPEDAVVAPKGTEATVTPGVPHTARYHAESNVPPERSVDNSSEAPHKGA